MTDSDVNTLIRLHEESDPRTIAEMKADDKFEEGEITAVDPYSDGDGWSLSYGDCYGLGCPKINGGPEPHVGDTLRVYTPGFGSQFHGLDINGQEVFWRTPWERLAERIKWLADHDRRRRENFAKRKDQFDADFDALPQPLQERIQRFRDEDPAFRVESESYELFACVEAAKFAEAAQQAVAKGANAAEVNEFWLMPVGGSMENGVREHGTVFEEEPSIPQQRWLVWAWALNTGTFQYDHDRQKQILGLADGHSGNTFGGAMRLAHQLLEGVKV